MQQARKANVRLGTILVLVLAGFGFGCSGGFDSEVITAENQDQLLQAARTSLSYEDVETLNAYIERTYPELPEGQLPPGRTIRQMIDEQKAFQNSLKVTEPPAEQTGGEEKKSPQGEVQAGQSMLPGASSENSASPEGTVSKAPAPDKVPAKQVQAEKVAAPPPPPPPTTATLPAGTQLPVRLTQSLSSKTNSSGQKFEAELDRALVVDNKVLAPEGSLVIGKLTNVAAAGKVKGRARMSLTLSEIRVKGETYPVKTNTFSYEAEGTQKKDATKVGVASGVGALVGAIAGGGKGAAIGAGVGAGAGTGVVLATTGDEVKFGVEQLFKFKLRNPVEMKIVRQ